MFFLIVIYNKKILESNSFKFLFKKENIIIFDNSDIFSLQQNNELFCQKEKIRVGRTIVLHQVNNLFYFISILSIFKSKKLI